MSGTNRPFGGRRFGGPFDILDAMQQEVNRVFRDYGFGGQERTRSISPSAEVVEEHDAYRVAVEIPGLDPQQVEVNLSGHTLTIQAERREHHQHAERQQEGQQAQRQEGQQAQRQEGQQRERRNVLLSEITYGHVRRSFEFESEIDTNRAQAEFRNGLLNITLPKSAQARDQQRRIEIKTS